MSDPSFPPAEPLPLRVARAAAGLLPKGRSAFVRAVAKATRAPNPFAARIGGLWFPVDLTERVSRTLYLFDTFETEVAAVFQALLAPGNTCLDVGANFGYFTLLAARRVGPAGHVFAFEPDPRNIARLQTALALNTLPAAQVVPAAVCDRPGSVRLHMAAASEDNLGTSSIVADAAGRTTVDVPALTLDAFIPAHAPQGVDLLKMDIEGAELAALRGARETLARHTIRHLLLELHRTILTPEQVGELHQWLVDAGYQARLLTPVGSGNPLAGLRPLTDPGQLTDPNPHLLYSLTPPSL